MLDRDHVAVGGDTAGREEVPQIVRILDQVRDGSTAAMGADRCDSGGVGAGSGVSSMRHGVVVTRLATCVAATVLAAAGCTSPHHATKSSGSSAETSSAGSIRFPDPAAVPLPVRQGRVLQAVLTDIVDPVVRAGPVGAPGVTAAVVSDNGSWSGAAGVDGFGRPLKRDAMMSIASITKTFVAAEVMRLVQAGDVALDDPISDHVSDSPANGGATVADVLSMRSGLRDPPNSVLEAMVKAQGATGNQHWSLHRVLTYLNPKVAAPGGAPVYANVNYLLLGMLVEDITKKPLPVVERADLIARAGLVRIATQNTERPGPPVALAARNINAHPDGYLPDEPWAGAVGDSFAGLAADAATVARWGYQLYGARVLDAASVKAMETPPSVESVFPGIAYGLGTMVFEGLSEDPTYGHIGQDPGYTSILVVDPRRHLAAALLVVDSRRFMAVGAMRSLLTALQ